MRAPWKFLDEAFAQVTQTDAVKTPLPQPVSAAELNLVNDSWGWNANTMVNRDTASKPMRSQ
jgi:hypothetical protein